MVSLIRVKEPNKISYFVVSLGVCIIIWKQNAKINLFWHNEEPSIHNASVFTVQWNPVLQLLMDLLLL